MSGVLGMNAFDVRPGVDAFFGEDFRDDGIVAEVEDEVNDIHGDGGVFQRALGGLHVVLSAEVENFLKPTVYE